MQNRKTSEIKLENNLSPVQHFNKHLYETGESFRNNNMPYYNTIDKYNINNGVESEDSFENKVKNIPKSVKSKQPSTKISHNTLQNVRSPSSKLTINTTPGNRNQKPKTVSIKKDMIKIHSSNPVSIPSNKVKKNDTVNNSNKNEVATLKKEIARLNLENAKLKEQLQNEKNQNIKFKELAEELIKYYE
jgi:hypothetical protein